MKNRKKHLSYKIKRPEMAQQISQTVLLLDTHVLTNLAKL